MQPKIRDVVIKSRNCASFFFAETKIPWIFLWIFGCRHTSESLTYSEGNYLSSFPTEKRKTWHHGVMPYMVEGLYSERSTGRGSSTGGSISCRRRLEAPFSPLETKYSLKLVETTTKKGSNQNIKRQNIPNPLESSVQTSDSPVGGCWTWNFFTTHNSASRFLSSPWVNRNSQSLRIRMICDPSPPVNGIPSSDHTGTHAMRQIQSRQPHHLDYGKVKLI